MENEKKTSFSTDTEKPIGCLGAFLMIIFIFATIVATIGVLLYVRQ